MITQFNFNTAPNIIVSKPKMAVLSDVELKKHLQDHKWAISYSDGHVTTHKMLEFVNKRTGKNIIYKPTASAMLTTIGVFLIVAVAGVLIYTKMKRFWMDWRVWMIGSLVTIILSRLFTLYVFLEWYMMLFMMFRLSEVMKKVMFKCFQKEIESSMEQRD